MEDLPMNFLSRVNQIIETRLSDENFTIELLCKELAISYSHTYRKIRQETGLSPSMYVCKKRLETAQYLMAKPGLSLGEIAFRVGFNTQAYFSKCFADIYGMPPLKYRRKLKQNEKMQGMNQI